MGPYNGGAEWTLTREELSLWNFQVNTMESLSVRPSMSIQMSYPSGLIDDVNIHFRQYANHDISQQNSSTGRENPMNYQIKFFRHITILVQVSGKVTAVWRPSNTTFVIF